jgi:hypothetical protein
MQTVSVQQITRARHAHKRPRLARPRGHMCHDAQRAALTGRVQCFAQR